MNTEIYKVIQKNIENKIDFVLVTVSNVDGHTPSLLTSKMIVYQDGRIDGTIGGGNLEFLAIKNSLNIFNTKQSITCTYVLDQDKNKVVNEQDIQTSMICGGKVTLCFEYITSPIQLYLFGAGHINQQLGDIAKLLGWEISLFDSRQEFVNDYPHTTDKHLLDIEGIKEFEFNNRCLVVIATHSHDIDYEIVRKIYEAQTLPFYIGLVASKSKSIWIRKQIKKDVNPNINLDILYSPAGLDTGGRTPVDIAISIISEMKTVIHDKKNHIHLTT